MSFELKAAFGRVKFILNFVMMRVPPIDIGRPRDAKGRAARWIVAYQNWRRVDAGRSRTVQKPPAHSHSANGCTAPFEVPESCGQSNRMASRCMEEITDGPGKASRPFLT